MGDEGRLPNEIHGFLDLTNADLPPNHGIKHAGSGIEAAVCAVVENALCANGGEATSEIFVPVAKEVEGLTNNRASHLRFCLADAEAFVESKKARYHAETREKLHEK